MFLTRHENDSLDCRKLTNQLNDSEYPSLDWMHDNTLLDNKIPPGSKNWKPIDTYGTPPYGLPKAKPSSIKEDLKETLNDLLESLNETVCPETTMVNFFRIDTAISPNECYDIPVPPKYIKRADNGERGDVGADLIYQARYLAKYRTGMSLFTANLQQYREAIEERTMKIRYIFNDCKYELFVFRKISIDDIMGGNAITVNIEMIVEDEGAQI